MKQASTMAEDMFEKAREAFFGTAKARAKPSVSSAESLKPRNDPPEKQVTDPADNGQEPDQPPVLTR
jgi:hypothetical protein